MGYDKKDKRHPMNRELTGPSVTIAIMPLPKPKPKRKAKKGKKKAEMAYGGMSGGKKHMYAAGGSVKMNPGLKALQKEAPEVVARMLKK